MAHTAMGIMLDRGTSKLTALELFEATTRHFCAETNLPLLARALKRVLGVDDDCTPTDVSCLFAGKGRLWRY